MSMPPRRTGYPFGEILPSLLTSMEIGDGWIAPHDGRPQGSPPTPTPPPPLRVIYSFSFPISSPRQIDKNSPRGARRPFPEEPSSRIARKRSITAPRSLLRRY